MTASILVLCSVVFGVGLVTTFAGTQLRGRLTGLATMAAAGLISLAVSDPARAGTWWMVVTGGLTLVGLVAFAMVLGRWAATGPDDDLSIDDLSLDEDPL